jgi:hypothetical protein
VKRAVVAAAMIVACAGGTACGTDEEAERRKADAAQAEKKRAAEQERKERAAAKARQQAEDCGSELDPFIDTISELDSRLDIGLSYDEYTNEVADMKVEYDKIDFDAVSDAGIECLQSAGLPAEQALRQHVKAAQAWSECFDDFNCENDTVKPELQRLWAKASRQGERARRGLSELAEPS